MPTVDLSMPRIVVRAIGGDYVGSGGDINLSAALSPDLNPIEMAFSKFKAHLRKAGELTIPGLLCRIGRVVKAFSPKNARISCATQAMFKRERSPL
jgi:hypothetical protein